MHDISGDALLCRDESTTNIAIVNASRVCKCPPFFSRDTAENDVHCINLIMRFTAANMEEGVQQINIQSSDAAINGDTMYALACCIRHVLCL